jgi:xanthine/CO dehydrogenase XdhC/CoxF family maturation factor
MNTILDQAAEWVRDGRKVAMATVIETWGSAPQPVGSQLAIDADGNFLGSVSGGA